MNFETVFFLPSFPYRMYVLLAELLRLFYSLSDVFVYDLIEFLY